MMDNTEQENVRCDEQYDASPSTRTNIYETNPQSIIDDESDGPDEPSNPLELTSELTFSNWEDFRNWIRMFGLKEGFNYKIRTSETIQGVMRRATYECTKSGSHISQAMSDPTKQRNTHSQRTLCPWKLNVACPKTSGIVRINSFNNVHNHPLISMIQEMAPRFRKLTKEMLADIEKYVVQGRMDSTSIYTLLKHDYPNQPIHKKDLYNAVYQFRQKHNPGDGDASQMLQLLMDWKDSDPLWIIKTRLDPVSRRLISLLWMSPTQKDLYNRYNDVVIVDSTYNTNRFQMILCVVTVVDNNYRTRIVACAIIEDETLDTYRWIFDNLNLRKKLKGKLGSQFEEFRHKFYVCRNSLCEQLFELRWNQLVEQYPAAVKYLSDTLYCTKDSWAVPWVRKRFTAGAQSTQRIESINKHVHNKVDRSTSLCNLLISINDHVNNDEHLERFEVERNALPTIGLPMLNTRFFDRVDAIIKEFLTPIMLGKQREQMNQSVCYDINQITEWHHLMEVETDDEEIGVGIREQERDTRQVLFRSLVSNLPTETILEVWNVRATGTQGIGHYTILLDEGTHLCTCLLLINKGLTQSEDDIPFQSHATFQHFFSIRIDSYGPQSSQSSQLPVKSKAMYAELSGLSKKAIDYATKADMQHELLNVFKAFIYDVQGRLEVLTDINNPIIVKHKGRPPKRLISNVEKDLHRERRVLKDIVNVVEEHCISSHIEDSASGTKGRKCSKCKQYGHYAKTCPNVI
ncbi:unnamed protein product [Rhizophagus irregularis]|nr:unnamed protein product [Rhizophagus irregularis]